MKFYGVIGFADNIETAPGIWEEVITERHYKGDLLRSRRNYGVQNINGSITVGNQLSIVSDPYLDTNFTKIRYVEFNGNKWTVEGVDVERPRLLLSFGGLYNENSE